MIHSKPLFQKEIVERKCKRHFNCYLNAVNDSQEDPIWEMISKESLFFLTDKISDSPSSIEIHELYSRRAGAVEKLIKDNIYLFYSCSSVCSCTLCIYISNL